ncbi:MAG: histidinol-phosphate transaminase [Lachnospiraceae bacterium]|nr:histidinol-phosphate transaminase [Lachnospiraceae bacterium]MDD7627416.1 histidinol-phosphate transaminase [Lachnospiraceae bacterium]MDY4119528.1 histidinol-phosphate transaminase [Lachnospiraceae bacterium]
MSWEANVRKVEPYVAGEQPKNHNIIKLNTNECPYPPAPGVAKRAEEMNCGDLRLYPDMNAEKLVNSLSEYYHVDPAKIFVGVGSDDVLAMSFMTFFNSDKPILFPDITYSFYDVWAELYRIPYKTCALTDDFHMKKEDYMVPNGGVIFPNPNAPTGVLESVDMIEEIIRENRDVVVIIDEAYVDFGGESVLPLIDKYDNLLVVQTFSKSRALAGMRIGFAMGSEKLIGYLKDAKFSFNSYTLNMPAIEMGVEAVKDDAYFKKTVNRIIATRERVKGELKELGFDFTDSKSNFLFATHKTVPAGELFRVLKENGIYVRYWNKKRIDNRLRITIGTDEQMDRLISFLKEYLK